MEHFYQQNLTQVKIFKIIIQTEVIEETYRGLIKNIAGKMNFSKVKMVILNKCIHIKTRRRALQCNIGSTTVFRHEA